MSVPAPAAAPVVEFSLHQRAARLSGEIAATVATRDAAIAAIFVEADRRISPAEAELHRIVAILKEASE